MPPHSRRSSLLRSPLLTVLGAGALLLACGAPDDTGTLTSPYRHPAGTASGGAGGGSTSGGGSASTGSSSPSSGSGAASGGGTSSGGTAPGGSGGTPVTPPSTGGGVDAGGAAPPPAPATPAFALAVDDAAPSLNLADSKVVTVTVTPQGWEGAVTLTAAGLPADVKGVFDNATVNLNGTAPVTAKLTLTSIDASKPVATPFQVTGTVGETVKNAAATLTVKPYITINIPVNADSLTSSFGTVHITAPADIASNPVMVNFVNLDSTLHEIHADNPKQGFAHGQGTFAQGQADAPIRKVTVAGTYSWHLHDDAPPAGPPGGTVVIQ